MLGRILWEMLAGRPLFAGGTDYETLELVRVAHVPPLVVASGQLEAIVRKALAKYPRDRYQTLAELGGALGEYLVLHRRK